MILKDKAGLQNRAILNKILAITGTLLVWPPVAAPVFFSVVGLIASGVFNVDYLMPAELFLLVLVGGLLLLWAALRARMRRRWIAWSLGSVVLLPVLGSLVAKVTGLADGRIEPTGWQWALVLAFLAGYVLAIIALGVGGILLIRDVFRMKAGDL
jgi:hypothetical protein